jgi:thiosulfate/3-mercaptopyruvate sulfurtransferase
MIRIAMLSAALVVGAAGCGADNAVPGSATTLVGGAASPPDTIFVRADWLIERVGGDGVAIIFVGSNDEYAASHIPGARLVSPGELNEERDDIPNVLVPAQRLERTFAAAGVRGDERVVVYGAPLAAARAFVALERLGHPRASILDGGFAAWTAAGGTVDSGVPAALPPAQGRWDHDDELIVDAVWMRERLDDPAYAFIDARPPGEHTGAVEAERVPRPGHIPGSTNLFWERLIVTREQPLLRDEGELRALFEEAGAGAGRTLVVYCRTGMQSSFAYAVARHLGYPVLLYDGSFVDWSRRRDLPVAR